MTIPASNIVSVNPEVIGSGVIPSALNGVILSQNTLLPTGQVMSFVSAQEVSNFFGPASVEYALAQVYFLGFDNSTAKPGALLIAQYNTSAVSAYVRSGNIGATFTLAQLQAITSGTLIITINGTPVTSASINLSTASSYSSAATIIQTAIGATCTCTYDSVSGGFIISSTTTGATSTITYCTGTLASTLLLTQATGAVTSQGAATAVPATFMNALIVITTNWVTFFTAFDPDSAGVVTNKLAFAAWTNTQNSTYAYIVWDVNANGTASSDTSSLMYQVNQATYSGTFGLYVGASGTANYAAAVAGFVASINFNAVNGRTTLAFRTQSGLTPVVSDAATAANLKTNNYNYFGTYGTASTTFNFLYPGQVSGPAAWLDSFVDHVWLDSNMQISVMTLLTTVGAVPYNQQGYGLIQSAILGPVQQGLTFGAIRTGVTLSTLQAAEVNQAAGVAIDQVLTQQGYYIQVNDPGATVRAARGTPVINVWYMDGQAVQVVTIASIEVA